MAFTIYEYAVLCLHKLGKQHTKAKAKYKYEMKKVIILIVFGNYDDKLTHIIGY